MKKSNYSAPQIEIVRFRTEDVLAPIISSVKLGEDIGSAGKNIFENTDAGFNPFDNN